MDSKYISTSESHNIVKGSKLFLNTKFYQKFSWKDFLDVETIPETSKCLVSDETLKNENNAHGICNAGFSTLYNKTTVNNVTFYVTEHVMKLGRLGNMMFRYASILGIARKQGRQMFTEPGTDLGQTFKLSYEAVKKGAEKWPVIAEENLLAFDAKLMNLSLQNLRIDGYLQSFCYFAEIMDEVRQEFTFQDHITVAALNLLNEVHINHNASVIVGVHARRGDIMEKRWYDLGLRVPEKSYFVKAFRLLKLKCPGRNITFIVVSDDMTWCRENLFGQGVVCMPPASAAVHLAVLSMCDHVIINGGTYGWWAGWLAKGYVIYYTAYMANGTYFGRLVNRRTYYPPQWIGLEN